MPRPKVTVYTFDFCPYCHRAKELLKVNNVEFEEIEINPEDDAARISLEKRSGMRTFPQIFFGDRLVGGFTDLQKLDQEEGIVKVLDSMI